ncbi:hypothetical protein ZWY2020_011283 [Hordeum vulgare]|nr:hypothetical protein ZWY2020_011283 [Hordeum vulgare]
MTVRLAPGAPWFFFEEQRLRLRSSPLVSLPDLAATPRLRSPAVAVATGGSPASVTSHARRSSGGSADIVLDSAPLSPSIEVESEVAARIQVSSPVGATTGAFNAANWLHSVIIVPARSSHLVNAPPAPRRASRPVEPVPREEGWTSALRRRRPRRDTSSSRAPDAPSHPAPRGLEELCLASFLRFKKRTDGLCSRCLAPKHHHFAACRDPVRCLSCNLSGHIERSARCAVDPSRAGLPRPPRHNALLLSCRVHTPGLPSSPPHGCHPLTQPRLP